MTRLVLGDLWIHARVWWGILMVSVATGGIGAIGAGLIETGNHYGGDVQYDLAGASTILIVLSAATALIVLSSTADLTVALQQRSYALWQLAGLSPLTVAAVVLCQLAVVGSLGAAIGWGFVKVFAAPIFDWLWQPLEFAEPTSVHLGAAGFAVLVVVQSLVVMLGGLRGARTASRVSPIEALRAAEATPLSFGWFRILLFIALLTATGALSLSLMRADFETIAGNAILLVPMIAALFAVAGPVVFRPVLKAWTSIIPSRWSASWYLARNSAAYRLGQSSASIAPLMIAVALPGGLFTTAASLSAAVGEKRELSAGVVILMLGGPLLLAGIGAVATVFMSGYAREREFALIRAAGSTTSLIVLTAVWEALIYTVTAAILATTAIVVGAGVLALALDVGLPVLSLSSVATVSAAGFVLLLAATLIPTLLSLRVDIPGQLALE
ncbi:putative ABC transport system permease protein [Arthrobacter sp. UYP6]|uniref:FtsX-like permease family protein n=1 Tax=Arthrobacter sp. UYP6 TaxID=1756378 RepID=UPI003390F401